MEVNISSSDNRKWASSSFGWEPSERSRGLIVKTSVLVSFKEAYNCEWSHWNLSISYLALQSAMAVFVELCVMTHTEFWDFVLLNQLWRQRVSFSITKGSEHYHLHPEEKTRTKYNERTWAHSLVTVFRLTRQDRTNLWNTCKIDKLIQWTTRDWRTGFIYPYWR